MSHGKERHEKICLNCNAELIGRYCQVCGQENIEPKETVWSLVNHFFADITHFDGKFFSTTKYLVTKPGFLPKEYISGRRARYLHPIRMYVFSSALFFLIFFSVLKPGEYVDKSMANLEKARDSVANLDLVEKNVLSVMHSREDSLGVMASFAKAKNKVKQDSEKERKAKDSLALLKKGKKGEEARSVKVKSKKASSNFLDLDDDDDDGSEKYKTVASYDSAQALLPEDQRDSWWERKIEHRNIELNARYGGDKEEMWKEVIEKFLHTFPYLLFVSLPLYAFFMKIIYWRRKEFYYADHGIFFIYLYIFTFLFLLIYYSVMQLHEYTGWGWMGWIEGILILAGIYYAYKAMRKFYQQGRAKTILKFMILNLLAFITVMLLFVIFFTLTLYRL